MTHSGFHDHLALRIVLPLLALGLLSPARVKALEWHATQLIGAAFDGQARPVRTLTSADLDGKGSLEYLALVGGRAVIRSGQSTLWVSPAEWTVTQAILADLNRDGSIEVAMVVWRPFAPWPVDAWLPHGGRINEFHDRAGQSCHLILVGWKDGHWREVWAGSALAEPLIQIGAADVDSDGGEELIALEGAYARLGSEARGSLAIWRWNGFGFTLETRAPGRYSQMQPVTTVDNRTLILAQVSWR